MANNFKTQKWDPILIISQIITIQIFTYLFASALSLISTIVFGSSLTLDYIFDVDMLNSLEVSGWVIMIESFIVAGFLCLCIRFVVERAKLCLDFACTFYFIHMVSCTFYSHFPTGLFWWFTYILQFIGVAVGSEYLCIQKELEPIRLTGTSKKSPIEKGDEEQIEMGLLEKI